MSRSKVLYNLAIKELNDNQGFSHLGQAKGTKEQQFQTLWGRTYGWLEGVPAKIQHNVLQRAYIAWANTAPERGTKLKLAKQFPGQFLTIETDPTGWNKGKLYPRFWGDLEAIRLVYKHRQVSLVGKNCLVIYYKCGRFYLSQPNKDVTITTRMNKVIALDPGIRNFITAFDGSEAFQITNSEDLARLAKLQAYHAKLHKKADTTKAWFDKKKVYFKMSRLRRRIKNLVKDLHRKLACYLAKSYDLIYVPTYRVKEIYAKNRSNKTNRKNQLNWSWYAFVQELNYRCAKHGSSTVFVSEAYTSKTCSKCGHIHYALGSNKLFKCPKCNHTLDRDLNGAINILHNSLYMQGGPG